MGSEVFRAVKDNFTAVEVRTMKKTVSAMVSKGRKKKKKKKKKF